MHKANVNIFFFTILIFVMTLAYNESNDCSRSLVSKAV